MWGKGEKRIMVVVQTNKPSSSKRNKQMTTNNFSIRISNTLPRLTMVVLMLVVLFSLFPARSVGAWYTANPFYRPGMVYVPSVYITDVQIPNYNYGPVYTLMTDVGPLAYRSPASTGAQTVLLRVQYEKWNGTQWVLSAHTSWTRQILAGQNSVRFPTLYIQPLEAKGAFRVTWQFLWASPTGASLGVITVLPNTTSDHVCVTPYRTCRSNNGYFQVTF
jgi:hypothetical protein